MLEPSPRACRCGAGVARRARSPALRRGRPRPCSSSTSPRATSSRCRSRCLISSASACPIPAWRAASRRSSPSNLQRSGLFAPIDQAAYIEKISNVDATPRFPDWRADQRAGAGHRPPARGCRTAASAPNSGSGTCSPASISYGQQYADAARQLAPHRPHHLRRDLRAAHRRQGLFRQPHRVRRRVRPEGAPRQAARAHGPGRRQREISHARRRSRAHAALLARRRQEITYMSYGQGQPARVPAQHRDRPARDRRQFPRHDVLAALLARWRSA